VVKVQQVARIGIAGKVKARGGGDAGTSLTTSNAEIARNTYAPKGFWRRRGICCVGAPRRWHRIACVAPPCICPWGAQNAAYCTFTTGC